MAISKRKTSKKQFARFDENSGHDYLWLLENDEEKQTVLEICRHIDKGTANFKTIPDVAQLLSMDNAAVDFSPANGLVLIWNQEYNRNQLIFPAPQSLKEINIYLMGTKYAIEEKNFFGYRLEWDKYGIHFIVEWYWDDNDITKASQEIIAALF